jgi:hypothetical protein
VKGLSCVLPELEVLSALLRAIPNTMPDNAYSFDEFYAARDLSEDDIETYGDEAGQSSFVISLPRFLAKVHYPLPTMMASEGQLSWVLTSKNRICMTKVKALIAISPMTIEALIPTRESLMSRWL